MSEKDAAMEWMIGTLVVCAVALVFLVDALRVRLDRVANAQEGITALLEESARMSVWDALKKHRARTSEMMNEQERGYREVLREIEKEKVARSGIK
jgi:hypothetical protein